VLSPISSTIRRYALRYDDCGYHSSGCGSSIPSAANRSYALLSNADGTPAMIDNTACPFTSTPPSNGSNAAIHRVLHPAAYIFQF